MLNPLNRGRAFARAALPVLVPTARGIIELAESGDGPAVLALHGGMGGYDQSLLLARATLGDDPRHRVLALSRPGYLGTPQARGATPEQQADLYAALLDTLGIDRAIVIAVSAGGPSALHFGLRHPSRCAGVVLVSCCTGTLEVPPQVRSRLPMMKWIARVPGLVALMRWGAARDPDKAASRSIRDPELRARTLAHPIAGAMLAELQTGVFTRMAQRLPGTLTDTATFAAMPPIDVSALAPPLLAIHGTADAVVPFAHAERVARAAPHGELLAIEGGEHVSLFTHLDEVRARVGDFVSKCCST
ncbi:Alpha/beta hydrolase [Rhodopseudomonas palustris HaA2]|uniref:Alpha/beta hydrolase n=1 Tax=Rhodopseudomonas palustris (strain HaA2) TaxID=316058 RepID=Q2IVT3_RHOP2|nr:alpha/beta hydrolase [Rhodopseudomonas palustris]ABD07677.1 Alpha/beta hydrolase [Rhodopseudomonas palustris HaA2]